MKRLLLILTVSLVGSASIGQCLSGDCENGSGSSKYGYGVYTGQFKDGLPHGEGKYHGYLESATQRDSVLDEGIFESGFFIKGHRTKFAGWGKQYWKSDRYGNAINSPPGQYILTNNHYELGKKEYPIKSEARINDSKVPFYAFTNIDQREIAWFGKLKKGLMHGPGRIEGVDVEMDVVYDNGIPVSYNRTYKLPAGYKESSIEFQNGATSKITLLDKDSSTYIITTPLHLFAFLTNPKPSSTLTKRYKSGLIYNGEYSNGKCNGYGEEIYGNGYTYRGYFYQNVFHGPGEIVNPALQFRDSGLFLFNKFMKGIAYRKGQAIIYPICDSGNCENGYGKVRHKLIKNDTLYDNYEGYFVNGLPSGAGKRSQRLGVEYLIHKGNFNGGMLNGEGEIIGNRGYVRSVKGQFYRDTLISGTISYYDGSRFVMESNNREPFLLAAENRKWIRGKGTYYLKSGNTVTGEFYDNKSSKGYYQSKDGVAMNFGWMNGDAITNMGVNVQGWLLDYADQVAVNVVAQKNYLQAKRDEEARAFAEKERKRKEQETNLSNQANWVKSSGSQQCGACNGTGQITYTNTFGRAERYEKRKTIGGEETVKGSYGDGRTYTSKLKCDACSGKGTVTVTSEKYVGPR